MKSMMCLGLVCCLVLNGSMVFAGSWDSDPGVVGIEAKIFSESGTLLNQGGPWPWSLNGWVMNVTTSGVNMSLAVYLLGGGGEVLYQSSVSGISLAPSPMGPFGSPLLLVREAGGIQVVGANALVTVQFDSTPDEIAAIIDIKPGSQVNPVNVKSKGTLPVAIIGKADFDVSRIKPDSVRVAGVRPRSVRLADVSGGVSDAGGIPDGIDDLLLHVDVPELVATFGNIKDGDLLDVEVKAELDDGMRIHGSDAIRVQAKGKK